ncbi:uncharacterized protein F4807DRAFT_423720 [Annulohypoxylon truncatum]|uniref:uncharacterized protein n=1 Tax=Annulohypoxylon truncatum TaxID=327061 RepID=UPI0020072ADB|nr:uncharacterized protein F4807DRAFT_423720 [Annulohypoxylon truncatum]KAI1210071.1 hypothetical protein F4807DRAFT_423720 [Annulohypoxylon truncatum]
MMATCGTCWKEFRSDQARQQHMDAFYHHAPEHECDTCFRFFHSFSAVVNHMNAKNHWQYKCNDCDDSFLSKEWLRDHEVEDHFYCDPCKRYFSCYNNIKMHLNSRIHRGQNMQCPFCKQRYTTATGAAHHIESGSCPSAPGLDRDLVYRIIRAKDPNHIISNKLLEWSDSTRYEATSQAWNGFAYECSLCHRQFQKLESLSQHLSSPVHQQNLYHCPKRIACGREFTSLAGLMNHLESESCGYTKFENVQKSAAGIMSSDRLIGF